MSPFVFIVALAVAVIIAVMLATEKRKKTEYDTVAQRCTIPVTGKLANFGGAGMQLIPRFGFYIDNRYYEVPYYTNTAKNRFVKDREYQLYVDIEKYNVCMTAEEKMSGYNMTGTYVISYVRLFFLAVFGIFFTMKFKPELFAPLVVLTIGLAFIGISALITRISTANREKTTYLTQATVIDYEIKRTDSGNTYYPIYQYQYGDETYTATSNVSQLNREEFRRNQQIDIYLDPDDPQNSVIVALRTREGTVLKVFRIIGIICSAIGSVLLVLSLLQ